MGLLCKSEEIKENPEGKKTDHAQSTTAPILGQGVQTPRQGEAAHGLLRVRLTGTKAVSDGGLPGPEHGPAPKPLIILVVFHGLPYPVRHTPHLIHCQTSKDTNVIYHNPGL